MRVSVSVSAFIRYFSSLFSSFFFYFFSDSSFHFHVAFHDQAHRRQTWTFFFCQRKRKIYHNLWEILVICQRWILTHLKRHILLIACKEQRHLESVIKINCHSTKKKTTEQETQKINVNQLVNSIAHIYIPSIFGKCCHFIDWCVIKY